MKRLQRGLTVGAALVAALVGCGGSTEKDDAVGGSGASKAGRSGTATGGFHAAGQGGSRAGASGGSDAGGTGGGVIAGEGGTGAAASGGSPTAGQGDSGAATTGGSGATATGGVGAATTAGSPAAGASGFGAEGGSGATSGGGAAGAEACSAAPEPGNCEAAIPAWYHDPATGLCLPFVYGGCGGNANNYSTRERCLPACRGGEPDLDACEAPSDCMVWALGCCGACEPFSDHGLIALRVDGREAYDAVYGCGDVQCEPCLGVVPAERTRQFFYPTCVDGQCTVRDVREQDFTRCASSADCRLRCGSGCCESCSNGGDLIAVNGDANLNAVLCDDEPAICPACVCTIPEGAGAECVDGRCVVNHPPICTPGMDQTCNESPISSAIAGTCNDDETCTCIEGYTLIPETGRCL